MTGRGRLARSLLGAAGIALALASPAGAQQLPRSAQGAAPVVAGGSFNTAPVLAPGRYSDTLLPQETNYYRVRLAKGQVLEARVILDTSPLEQRSSFLYHLDLYTPLRQRLLQPGDLLNGSVVKSGALRGPRVLGFEQLLGGDYSGEFLSPGEWYLSLNADGLFSGRRTTPAEMPYQLEVIVTGAPQPSSRDFGTSLPGPSPEGEDSAPGASTQPASPVLGGEEKASDPTLVLLVLGAAAALTGLLLGGLAAALLGRRREHSGLA